MSPPPLCWSVSLPTDKEKKIKKEKPQPVINEDEKPFELPQGWVWCRLNDLALSSEQVGAHNANRHPRRIARIGLPDLKVVVDGSVRSGVTDVVMFNGLDLLRLSQLQ